MNEYLMPTPRSVEIAITGRCNLHCQYCFYANEMTALSDLITTQWLTFFDQLGQLGMMDVCLTGGEVFTRRDLFELIDGIIANHMRYSLLTNGTLINEDALSQFEKGKRRQRLDSIQVSIDGSTADIHNLTRPNSFERSVHGLRLLKEAGLPLTVRVTINRYNMDDLPNIARFLLIEIGLPSFSTNDAMPLGRGCLNAHELSLLPSETSKVMDTIRLLKEQYPGRLNALAGPQAKRIAYYEMEYARSTGKKSENWQMGYLTACGCVFSKISVMHDGTIVPCHLLSGLILGNITKDSLGKIWQSHPIMIALRERSKISMRSILGCSDCEWAEYCNGGCPGLAYQLTGDINRANPQDCYRNYLSEKDHKNVFPNRICFC